MKHYLLVFFLFALVVTNVKSQTFPGGLRAYLSKMEVNEKLPFEGDKWLAMQSDFIRLGVPVQIGELRFSPVFCSFQNDRLTIMILLYEDSGYVDKIKLGLSKKYKQKKCSSNSDALYCFEYPGMEVLIKNKALVYSVVSTSDF